MAKKSKGAGNTRKQPKKFEEEKGSRGAMKSEERSSLARPDQQAGGPEHHGLDAEEDRNP